MEHFNVESTGFVKKLDFRQIIAAEVGVRDGINAVNILEKLDIKKLYLIDHYLPYEEEKSIEIQEAHYIQMFKTMQSYLDKVVFVTRSSVFAAQLFKDNFFDFVFIDAEHTYESIIKDLEAWYPKVKANRVLAGHDAMALCTIKAVEEFSLKHDLKLAENYIEPPHEKDNPCVYKNKVYLGKDIDISIKYPHSIGDFIIIK